MTYLAEIPYPVINPILLDLGTVKVRWYGVTYIIAFMLAALVLRGLSRRGRFPVAEDRVIDVLFWGILGVFLGGRIGYFMFYGDGQPLWHIVKVWDGGMSFHGGLLGVIVAYWLYCWKTRLPRGEFFDGLSLATGPGILVVRLGNFINAELWGRPFDGAWAMRFPRYSPPESLRPELVVKYGEGSTGWFAARADGVPEDLLFGVARHPSQLYQGLTEGLLLFFVCRYLMLKRGLGGGRIAASFLIGYGAFRFVTEFFRMPDAHIGYQFGTSWMTRGQLLCVGMIIAGAIVWLLCKPYPPKGPADAFGEAGDDTQPDAESSAG